MNDIQQLVNKLLSWGCPILITIGILTAAIITGLKFLNGMSSQDANQRKETIKQIAWTWGCAIGLILIPTFVLIFKSSIITAIGG